MQTVYYYYLDENKKIVYYADEELVMPETTFLGQTNNPRPKMAVAVFLNNKPGYRIIKVNREA